MGVKLRKFADGWYIVVHHRGRRWTRKLQSREAGLRVLEGARNAFALGGLQAVQDFFSPAAAGGAPTVREYCDRWLEEQRHVLRASTWTSYHDQLRLHVYPTLGWVELRRLTYGQLKALVVKKLGEEIGTGKRKRRRSKNSVRLMVAPLRAALGEAMHEGLADRNVAAGLGRYWRGSAGHDPDPYSDEELARLYAACEKTGAEADRFWILALAETGLRIGEARGLLWDQVDLAQGLAAVVRNWSPNRDPGEPKTASSRRTVRIPVSAFEAERRRQLEKALAKGWPVPDSVWVGDKLGTLDYGVLCRRLRGICRKAKVRYRPPHAFRHSYASLRLSEGVPIVQVAAQLGDSPATVLKVYARWMPADRPETRNNSSSSEGASK